MAAKKRDDVFESVVRLCADCVPTNWLDPLLTGPDKVADFKDGPAIERLLKAVRQRILDHAISHPQGTET